MRKDIKRRGDTASHAAASGGHTETLLALIDGGANLDVESSSDGATPMMRAIGSYKENGVDPARVLACVRQLQEHGADVSARNFSGHTTLHTAFEAGLPEVVDLLIEHGAKPCVVDGRPCKKCGLNMKLRARRLAANPAPAPSRAREDTTSVLEEEFGDGDFLKALALAKDEVASELAEARGGGGQAKGGKGKG